MSSHELKILNGKYIDLLIAILEDDIPILYIYSTGRLLQSAEIYYMAMILCLLSHGACMLIIIVEDCHIIHGLILCY